MAIKTEAMRAGEHILSEANGNRSREKATIAEAKLAAGTVLGKIANGTASAAADAGNTGDGTMGAITVGNGALVGDYRLVILEPGTNAGDFSVEDPNGVNIGNGDVAAAFNAGGLSFTLADGATDFVAGDAFTITVAAGSGKYVLHDAAGIDGREVAVAVLYDGVDASAADVDGVITARDSEVAVDRLTFKTGISGGDKTAALLALKEKGIITR